MKIRKKLVSILGLKKKEDEKEETAAIEDPQSVLEEIELLKLLLFGDNVKEVPPGVLKKLAEQNQKIYWAVKDEESGLTVIDALKKIMAESPPRQRRDALRSLREQIDFEIADVNEEIAEEKILGTLEKHEKLSATDIAIYTSTSKDLVLKALDGLSSKGSVEEMKEEGKVFFSKKG